MKDIIKKNLNGRNILILFILTGIIYTIMLTITIPKVMSYAGNMKLLDMMPTGYNAAYVNSLLKNLGETGRHAYLFNQIPYDMIYPLLFGISFCLIIAYFLKKLKMHESRYFYICLLPIFSGLFDYLENFGIIAILNSYPENSDLLSQVTNVFSVLKSSFTTVTFILLIIILIVFGLRKILMKRQSTLGIG